MVADCYNNIKVNYPKYIKVTNLKLAIYIYILSESEIWKSCRKSLSYIFETPHLIYLSVIQNVLSTMYIQCTSSKLYSDNASSLYTPLDLSLFMYVFMFRFDFIYLSNSVLYHLQFMPLRSSIIYLESRNVFLLYPWAVFRYLDLQWTQQINCILQDIKTLVFFSVE